MTMWRAISRSIFEPLPAASGAPVSLCRKAIVSQVAGGSPGTARDEVEHYRRVANPYKN